MSLGQRFPSQVKENYKYEEFKLN
uniref:Uncharacterized protein n=1 Tax=Rhizophora mucronata TaxID=61149 RepID=A0A2P2NLF0_RHIMU